VQLLSNGNDSCTHLGPSSSASDMHLLARLAEEFGCEFVTFDEPTAD
jgi:hypothetical protein